MNERLLKNINLSLIFIVIFMSAVAMYFTRAILVPFVFSIFIYTIAAPWVDFIERKTKLPRTLSAGIVFSIFLLCSALLITLLSQSVESFYLGADIYKEKVVEWVMQVEDMLLRHGLIDQRLNLNDQIQDLGLFKTVKSVTKTVANFFSSFFLILVFVLFLIMGSSNNRNPGPLIIELQKKISKYLLVKTILSLITGTMVWVTLAVARVDLAFMFAVLTMLLNFIPNIGSIIATLLPLPIILLQYGAGWELGFVLIISGGTQFCVGNILEPKIMGNNLNLHPVAIILFLIFWGQIWGLPGMFLAVPITAILKIIFDRMEETKFIGDILAGNLPKH